MKMHDINKDQKDAVLLIHPMLADGEAMKTLLADRIGSEYRYLLPDLSGHGQLPGTKVPGLKDNP